MEIFATNSFQENTEEPYYTRALVFRLGGKYREYSLVEFSWRMGIYEKKETVSPTFGKFLRAVAREYSQGVNGYDFGLQLLMGHFIWVSHKKATSGHVFTNPFTVL